jgi:CheY-like chemotaxis protein
MLKESLEQDGQYHATVTTNGSNALRALSSATYDLAIIDLGLSEPDGLELARTIRQQAGELRLMLIPIKGDTLPPELSDLSIQGILPKPFFLPELPQRIADALEQVVGEAVGSQGEQAVGAAQEDDNAPGAESSPTDDSARITQQLPTPSEDEIAAARDSDPVAEVRERIPEIAEKMNALAQDVNAAAVLLTCKGRLLSHTGRVTVEEAMGLAQAATENWRTATRVAEILGQRVEQYEQSTEGGEYTFYSLTVVEDIILSIALNTHVPIGMVRHSVKGIADALRLLLNSTA